MRVSVINIGCKVNQYESDSIIRALAERGHSVYDSFVEADAYIINTCAVTSEAERKSRQSISRAKRLNPDAIIYITGCASENNPAQFIKDGVKYVSGTAGKGKLKLFEELTGSAVEPIPGVYEDDFRPLSLRTRNYVKVQDGCDSYCSYCVLPYLRGRSRSRDIESIKREIIENSGTETVLTGINLSSYGKDTGSSLSALLANIKGLTGRLRLGSLGVNIIDDGLLTILKEMKEFCPHFHLSLQSGDDKILKDMNRRYTTAAYLYKCDLIRKYFPLAAITTDLIVGFPTEDDKAFNNTLDFVMQVGFSDMHIFPYSRRAGTKAYPLKPLEKSVLRDRVRIVSAIRDEMRTDYNSKFIGKPLKVLIEEKNQGLYEGYSENYIKVYVNNAGLKEIISVYPAQIYKEGLKE